MSKPPALARVRGPGIREGDACRRLADVRPRLHRGGRRRIGHRRGADEGLERVGDHQRRIGGKSGQRLQLDHRRFRLTRGQGGVSLDLQRLHGGEVRLEFRHPAFGDPPIEQVAHAARRRERFVGHLEHPPGREQASGLLANRRREQALTIAQ